MTTSAKLNRMCQSSGVGAFCSSAGLDDAYRKRLLALATDTLFVERGSTLWRQGDEADALIWILSGAFKSTCQSACIPNGVTGLWFPGDLIGLDALCLTRRTATLAALVASEVAVMPIANITAQAGHDAGLMEALLRLLSHETLRHEEHMLLIAGGSSEQRVALFLIGLIARTGVMKSPDAALELYMTRDEIAAFLGLRMETVTRRLRELHHRGVIALSGRRVLIRDLNALAASACVTKAAPKKGLSVQQGTATETSAHKRASASGRTRSY